MGSALPKNKKTNIKELLRVKENCMCPDLKTHQYHPGLIRISSAWSGHLCKIICEDIERKNNEG